MPPPATRGIALLAGFQREAVLTTPLWPSASAAALTSLLPLLDLQVNDGVQKAGQRSTLSGLGPLGFDLLQAAPTVTVSLKLRYEGFESLWACLLGLEARRIGATLMPEALAAGAYRHLFEVDAVLSAMAPWQVPGDGVQSGDIAAGQRKVRRGTLAVDMQTAVWEWLSTMVQAATLQATPQGVTLTLELLSYSLRRDSVINTAATMAVLPPPTAPAVLFTDLALRVAPYSATVPLGSGDVVGVSSLTLRVENNLATSFGPRTGVSPEEFEKGQSSTVTLTLVFPRHTAELWQSRWGSTTALMLDAKWTGPLIPGTAVARQLNLYLPSAQVTNAQLQLAGVQVPPDVVQLVATVPSVTPAGFSASAYGGPLQVEVVSAMAQHTLL